MKKNIIKGLTLVGFFSLIFSYVAFQSGWLGTDENGTILFDPNGSVIKPNLNHSSDTLEPDSTRTDNLIIPSSKSVMIMPSSKSRGIMSSEDIIYIDGVRQPEKKKRFQFFKRKKKKKSQKHMGGSKSMIMFPIDSTRTDTLNIK